MKITHALFAALTGATLLMAPVQVSELTKAMSSRWCDDLVKNPEILVEMSNALRAKQESQQAENDKTLIQAHAKQLYSNQDPGERQSQGQPDRGRVLRLQLRLLQTRPSPRPATAR